jgi:thymidylate synthase
MESQRQELFQIWRTQLVEWKEAKSRLELVQKQITELEQDKQRMWDQYRSEEEALRTEIGDLKTKIGELEKEFDRTG